MIIRDFDDELMAELRIRAELNGHSVEAEAVAIIRAALALPGPDPIAE